MILKDLIKLLEKCDVTPEATVNIQYYNDNDYFEIKGVEYNKQDNNVMITYTW